MAGGPPYIYMCYHREQRYNNVEHLFIYKKDVHNDVETE